MSAVTPADVLKQVAAAVPRECLDNIIVVGSLAAGYELLDRNESFQVRTKDIDCVLSPRRDAAVTGEAIAQKLILEGWRHRTEGEFGEAGSLQTPDEKLPAVRLYPPNTNDWFIELLAEPDAGAQSGKSWMRVMVGGGHYGLPSFQYLSLATHRPVKTKLGISCARSEMMALALLLEHPQISPETMSGEIEGRKFKRSNKDLGRVLAIAFLSLERDENAMLEWAEMWISALKSRFPEDWRQLRVNVGSGFRELLSSPDDLEEALHTCNAGLLASSPVTQEQLRIAGERIIQDVIMQVETTGSGEG